MKRPQVIMVAAVATILGLFWFTHTREREPRYNEKSLSEWLRLYRPYGWGSPVESEEAADAVRHIGTNALPFLVNWIRQAQDVSPHRQGLFGMVWSWPTATPGREFLLESIGGRELRAVRGSGGFEILRETARDAVPDLVRAAIRDDGAHAKYALKALGYIGRDGRQAFFQMITNTTSPLPIKCQAVLALSQVQYRGGDVSPTIVVLRRCLDDPDLATSAATALGMLSLSNEISVPALIECTHSTNATLRKAAISSLGEFGRDARAAVPALTKLLNDPSASVRSEATNALNLIALDVPQPTSAP